MASVRQSASVEIRVAEAHPRSLENGQLLRAVRDEEEIRSLCFSPSQRVDNSLSLPPSLPISFYLSINDSFISSLVRSLTHSPCSRVARCNAPKFRLRPGALQ